MSTIIVAHHAKDPKVHTHGEPVGARPFQIVDDDNSDLEPPPAAPLPKGQLSTLAVG